MTPEQLAAPNTEAAHQTALFCWAALNAEQLPELRWLHHIPNGGSRGDARSAMIRGGQLKAQGVKAGVSDIFLPVKRAPWSGLYLELKKPAQRPVKRGRGGVTVEQEQFGAFVMAQGFGWVVAYSWDEAAALIRWYLTSERPNENQNGHSVIA